MDKSQALELIWALSNAEGAPGFEDKIAALLRKKSAGLGEVTEDKMRNVYVRRGENTGDRPVVQLDAHTDEVAFMVRHINPNGTLGFIPLGGWAASCVPAHRVRVRNADGIYIPGVIASKPPHFMSEAERKTAPVLGDMVIDIGSVSREETEEQFCVRIGEPVIPDVTFDFLDNCDIIIGKAFDCRLGCAAMLTAMRELAGEELSVDVVAAFAAQEEVGTRGAAVTGAAVRPDVAIVFEGCPADDTFGERDAAQTVLKRGPMLRHIDTGMITHPRFQRFALDLARELGVPVQEAVRSGGATNGASIHLSAGGVPVIVIGLPVRYIHTHYGIAAYADFEAAVNLACALLRGLSAEIIGGF